LSHAAIFSSENSILNDVSLEAAKKCKFKPAEMDGQRVKTNFNMPFKFALKLKKRELNSLFF
jgi:TonB family protein